VALPQRKLGGLGETALVFRCGGHTLSRSLRQRSILQSVVVVNADCGRKGCTQTDAYCD